jgi:hypothetical protein
MLEPKRFLTICLIAGTLLFLVGCIQGIREDMNQASNLGTLPVTLAHNYKPNEQSPINSIERFKINNKFTTQAKAIAGTNIQAIITVSSLQPDQSSDFYLDSLRINFEGEQNGESIIVRTYPALTDKDIYGATYQTSRVRLEICRYDFWKRVFGIQNNGCAGHYKVYEFKLYSNAPIQAA